MPAAIRRIALGLSLLPAALAGQRSVTLDKPEAELKAAFTRIEFVRELADGRALVVDQGERTVQLIDFRSGAAIAVGGLGRGPREYGFPGRLLPLPLDSSALEDLANARYMLITPGGQAGATYQLDDRVRSALSAGATLRGSDARGRMFFEGGPFTRSTDRIIAADSVPILRYDRAAGTLDTMAFVQLARGNSRATQFPGGGVQTVTNVQVFPARDDWTAMPDGGVTIVRVSDYHLERYSPSGQRVTGRPISVTPIVVTEAEKEALRESWRNAARGSQLGRGGGGNAGPGPRLPEREFPSVMPPFVALSAMARSNDEVWVLRSHRVNDNRVYDVFDGKGTMTARITLPPRARLIGFGSGTVYVARTDDDDLQYLQRYRLR